MNDREILVVGDTHIARTIDLIRATDGYKSMVLFLDGIEMKVLDFGVRGSDRDAYNAAEDARVEKLIDEHGFDDLPVSEFSDAIRELLLERQNIGAYALPGGFFDTSGSMPDTFLREMQGEITAIMGDFFIPPMEHTVDFKITDESLEALRKYVDADMTREKAERLSRSHAFHETARAHAIYRLEREPELPKMGYFPRNESHGAPRSIKETRRAQGRGKRQSGMSNWKRK